jgi:hypothetical protein
MATFALVHGSGDGGWAWLLVQHALHRLGHDSVAPDLPTDRDDAGWADCADAVVDALAGAGDVVVVGHSGGAMVAPLVAERVGAVRQVLVAGLVPRPGESADDWFEHVGWSNAVAAQAARDGGLTGGGDPMRTFYHDVPAGLADEALAPERPTSAALAAVPWPGRTAAPVPTEYVVTARDRFLAPALQRSVAAQRLGIEHPDEVDAGHCAALASPEELATLLARAAGPGPG